jgi:hypothetical protein
VAIERLSLTPQGNIRYALKTPYRDGTTHVIFEPLDFLVNLTRFHGVFAPNHRLRAWIVLAQRGGGARQTQAHREGRCVPRHVSMSWAQRLKRAFDIDIEVCERCGGMVKIIASIEDPEVIGRILEHLAAPRRRFGPRHARRRASQPICSRNKPGSACASLACSRTAAERPVGNARRRAEKID